MTNSIGDLLGKRKFNEPPEMKIIKDFVRAKFDVTPGVTVGDREISITVPGSALAGALRAHLWELAQLCKTTKRLVIRIQ